MRDDGNGLLHAMTETLSRATHLVQLEVRVFRAELAEKAVQVRAGLALVLSGAVLLAAALFLILQAIVLLLMRSGMSPMGAVLLVAAACIAIGFVLVLTGSKKFDAENLTPDRTIDDLQRSSTLVKEKLT
jgi:Putative Actinobacterial Holin-X, holin superfamily III